MCVCVCVCVCAHARFLFFFSIPERVDVEFSSNRNKRLFSAFDIHFCVCVFFFTFRFTVLIMYSMVTEGQEKWQRYDKNNLIPNILRLKGCRLVSDIDYLDQHIIKMFL